MKPLCLTPSSSKPKLISKSGEMPALTGLRGFAALWVLIYHAWSMAHPELITFNLAGIYFDITAFFSFGWAGVQIFFVLSGFLLSLPFVRWQSGMRKRPIIKFFFLRRITRVFPAYYVQFFLILGMRWLVQGHLPFDSSLIPHYLLMLFVPPPLGIGTSTLNGVWWTLPIEFSFYLILPLLSIFLVWKRYWILLIGALLMMVTWRWCVLDVFHATPVSLWSAQLPGSMDSFALGMVGAVFHINFYEKNPTNCHRYKVFLKWLLPLALITYILMFKWISLEYLNYWKPSLVFFSWTPICSLAVMIIILNGAVRLWIIDIVFGNRVIQLTGTISYGVYLWHMPVQRWLLKESWIGTMDGYRFPWLLFISTLITFLLASLSWVLIEKKAIALSRSYLQQKQS